MAFSTIEKHIRLLILLTRMPAFSGSHPIRLPQGVDLASPRGFTELINRQDRNGDRVVHSVAAASFLPVGL